MPDVVHLGGQANCWSVENLQWLREILNDKDLGQFDNFKVLFICLFFAYFLENVSN